jgi:Cu/Ag efflux protein CusF
MNAKKLAWSVLALLPAALLSFASCSSEPIGEGSTFVMETPDGAAIVETYSMVASITSVDQSTRKVTLTSPDGRSMTVKAAPDIDLAAVKVGDRVAATVTEELAVYLRKNSAPPSAGEGSAIAIATDKNGRTVFTAQTVKMTARVTGIDLAKRKVTLQFPTGAPKTLRVGKEADLASVKSGDDVVVYVSESFAVAIMKP